MTKRDEQFPRSASLPTQSPFFWVTQKDRYLRQVLIRDIESETNRRLLVYFATRDVDAQIDFRDCQMFVELFDDAHGQPVDLFIETPGGITDAAEALVRFVQSCTNDLRVVVANAAKSNGTLLALAAKSIVMGAPSELGPIEPSIQGVPCSILLTDEVKNSNFALHKTAEFALNQSRSMAFLLLKQGMMSSRTDQEIDAVVHALSSRDRYFSHGSVIHHIEAKNLGLNIEYLDSNSNLWKRIWLLYSMYEYDCRQNQFLKVFEGRSRSTAIEATK